MIKITQAMLDAAEEAAWLFSSAELQQLLGLYEAWPDRQLEALRDGLYAHFLIDRKDAANHISLREVDAVLAVRRLIHGRKQDWSARPRHRKEEPR